MMSRKQITLDAEIQRRARKRAVDLGVSLAEYVRRLVARDLGGPQQIAKPSAVFDLGASGGSDIARNKDAMLAEAIASRRRKPRRNMSLFVDTSIWYAAADKSDTGNSRAKAVLSSGEPLVTTDHVLVETWTLLRYRLGRRAAERFWEAQRGGVASVEIVGAADLEAAWEIGIAYRDQDFSLVDRTSFATMRRLGIDRAASLDDDFAIFRFAPNRRRAFVIRKLCPRPLFSATNSSGCRCVRRRASASAPNPDSAAGTAASRARNAPPRATAARASAAWHTRW